MRNFFGLVMLTLLAASCESNGIYSTSQSLPGYWDKNDTIRFELPQMDSLKKYNLFLNIRNTNEYPYNNLFLVATMEFPYGKTVTDTLEYKMAYPDGKWMGTGIGNIKENTLWYKEGISFEEEGNYNIIITQAVRNNGTTEGVTQLQGLTDIGIRIETATE